jgi:D-lactate dehydrogenase
MTEKTKQPKIKLAVFSSKNWVTNSFNPTNDKFKFEITFFEARLEKKTAVLAHGFDAVCVFVNDVVDREVLNELKEIGVKLVALRAAGFNNVDIITAKELGIGVVRVPAYSPYATAEHAVGLLLTLNRKYHKAHPRVRDGNFALDGLLGFDINGKTVGVIGTGRIGQIFAGIMQGFNCKVIAYDKFPSKALEEKGVEYVGLEELYRNSDIISLHCPLTYETYHMINEMAISTMRSGVTIINTSRGKLVDSNAVIEGLKRGKVGHLGLDVYEEEEKLFFEDLSDTAIQDDTFVRLQTFPNVLITAHQAFFTKEAVINIAETTFKNIKEYFTDGKCENVVLPVKK